MSYLNKFRQLIKSHKTVDQSFQQADDAKNDYLFDNLARTLGSSITRREALVAAMTGLAGMALVKLGINSAWAATNCICNGVTYDPQSSCCTPTGVMQKYPVLNSSQCPGIVPHIYKCVGNGCGAQGGRTFPHQFGAASFLNACNNHDCCYGSCEADKLACDKKFLDDMNKECEIYALALNPQVFIWCLQNAALYYDAVILFGQGPYDAAQSTSCECCSSSTCGEICMPGTYSCPGVNNPLNCCPVGYNCSGSTAGITKCCPPGYHGWGDTLGFVHCCPTGTHGSNVGGSFSCKPN